MLVIPKIRPKGIKLLKNNDPELKFPASVRRTINNDIRQKKIFIVDASAVLDIPTFQLNYAPILVLKLVSKNNLQPVMIQTSRERDAVVFTPQDDFYQWKLAKRLFEGVNSMTQTVVEHLLQCHLVVEIFATAAYRSFSYNHPVYKILYPHIKTITSINAYARQPKSRGGGLIGDGGFVTRASPLSYENIQELFHNVLQTWSPDEMNLPKYLEDNGLTEDILQFPYAFRDDGMKEKGMKFCIYSRYSIIVTVCDFFLSNFRKNTVF